MEGGTLVLDLIYDPRAQCACVLLHEVYEVVNTCAIGLGSGLGLELGLVLALGLGLVLGFRVSVRVRVSVRSVRVCVLLHEVINACALRLGQV